MSLATRSNDPLVTATPLKDVLVAHHLAHEARRAEHPTWWDRAHAHIRRHGAWASLRCALVEECAACSDAPPPTVITVADLAARLGRDAGS